MNDLILVTGGTGAIGSRVVPLLREAGRDVRILSRHPRTDEPGVHHVAGDTFKNEGLDAAFRGASTVLHLAGGAKGDDVAARHVVAAAKRAGIRHLLLLSVIGADDVPIGYMRMKAEAERIVRESGVPFTVLRVSQLHSLLLTVLAKLARMPLAIAPRDVRLEPIDGDAVASRLTELTLGSPGGRVPDLAGPEVLEFAEILAQYNAAHGRERRILRMPLPGAAGRAYRDGANLADGSAWRAGPTWRQAVGEELIPANATAV